VTKLTASRPRFFSKPSETVGAAFILYSLNIKKL